MSCHFGANEHIEMSILEACFAEILPRFATSSLKHDPDEFQKKFGTLKQMWLAGNW